VGQVSEEFPEFAQDVYLIKPSALEARLLAGVEVDGFTGCGDQVMAALYALLCHDWELADASKLAIRAGTLQFHRTRRAALSLNEIMTAPEAVDRIQYLPGD
jgi:bifunctional ADP-heptose synthase (sugar kinase/adenylyltransferase)